MSRDINIVCLDMEGVITPEIWIAFAEKTGISELRKTTREEPDYDRLMKWRMGLLREKGYTLADIQETIRGIDLLPGAKDFIDSLRRETQVVILSDTFYEFAMPFMEKLGYPSLFCNRLNTDENNMLTSVTMRCADSKLTTVRGLQAMGFQTIAAGDSYNDLDMIMASKAGFLFRTTEKIKADHPAIAAFESYEDLYDAIIKAL